MFNGFNALISETVCNLFRSVSSVVIKYSAFPSNADATCRASFALIPCFTNLLAESTRFSVSSISAIAILLHFSIDTRFSMNGL